ncbi:MAG: hypothetical protein PWQ82_592 [Thermosediminibacterales bacterium]|nr:hypothetical protein [Thermosediminibacterales bacterium]MDK2835518.1 hypothetical protein [Thermosediminibacterales bacterium]
MTGNRQKRGILYSIIIISLSLIITIIVMYNHNKEISLQEFENKGETGEVYSPEVGYPSSDDLWLLARLVSGEARGEPYQGQVAVAAVILNRVRSPKFPATVAGVIYQPHAFESVSNGQIWAKRPSAENIRAARAALNGWDPTYGSLFFWNPFKKVSKWIWSRKIVQRIGRHVFGI